MRKNWNCYETSAKISHKVAIRNSTPAPTDKLDANLEAELLRLLRRNQMDIMPDAEHHGFLSSSISHWSGNIQDDKNTQICQKHMISSSSYVVRHWNRLLTDVVDVPIAASVQGWFEWSSEQPGPWQAGLGLDDL